MKRRTSHKTLLIAAPAAGTPGGVAALRDRTGPAGPGSLKALRCGGQVAGARSCLRSSVLWRPRPGSRGRHLLYHINDIGYFKFVRAGPLVPIGRGVAASGGGSLAEGAGGARSSSTGYAIGAAPSRPAAGTAEWRPSRGGRGGCAPREHRGERRGPQRGRRPAPGSRGLLPSGGGLLAAGAGAATIHRTARRPSRSSTWPRTGRAAADSATRADHEHAIAVAAHYIIEVPDNKK
jgi:hypothetical protein